MLLDLGISSPQFDDAHRGFRPEQDGPLDLRFDQSKGVSAHEYLSTVERSELARVLKLYGDGKHARSWPDGSIDLRIRQTASAL